MTQDLFEKCRNFEDAKRVQAAGIYPFFRPIETTSGSAVVTRGRRCVMIGSNNYLGLTHHPRVMAAATRAIHEYGTGCTGSRFLNGNLALHEELEERLARFLGREACLIFGTGFLSNHGALSCLLGRHDVVYSDRDNHASIVEGVRSCLGSTIRYRHNDMVDLARVLKRTRSQYSGALIVADGVFSMSGEILDFPAVVKLAGEYNCRVYIDDAHALGVLGARGQGTEFHYSLPGRADLVMGTFSKSFASMGGFIAGNADVIHYVKHKARSFIFSAAMPPSAVATVLECLKVVEEEPEHLERLWKNTRRMHHELAGLGYDLLQSRTPIIPLRIGEDDRAFTFAQRLYERGIFATPVVSPAVSRGGALIRTSYLANHSDADLDYVLEVLEDLGREFGLLGNRECK